MGHTVPDLLGPDVRLLFVGINPGLLTAAVQAHFARRGNRFYPALYRAGIVDRLIDASSGYAPTTSSTCRNAGSASRIWSAGATARADEVARADLVAGVEGCGHWSAGSGLASSRFSASRRTASRSSSRRRVVVDNPTTSPAHELWVAPNPSGLNAHATPDSLATDYREIAIAAGIRPVDPPSSPR